MTTRTRSQTKERLIEVKLTGCTVFLYPDEIQTLLQRDTDLFKEGLKRGKGILRHRKQKQRETLKFEKET